MATEEPAQAQGTVTRGELLETDALKFLLSSKKVPPELIENFWIWTDTKMLALSNLRLEDCNQFLSQFGLDVLVYLAEKKGEITWEEVRWINQLRAHVKLALLRSTGGPERERKVVATAYRQTYGTYEEHLPATNQKGGGGLFAKIRGK
jgi:hypothetical protein